MSVESQNLHLSRRQFLRLGSAGSALLMFAPLLQSKIAHASPVIVPPGGIQDTVHGKWMKLSFNLGLESAETRRRVGAALRYVGAIKGQGLGADFSALFDAAVERLYSDVFPPKDIIRIQSQPTRPHWTLFQLIQILYDDYIFPFGGSAAGVPLFGILFSILRGRDGTGHGDAVHRVYQVYRRRLLLYKDIARLSNNEARIKGARKNKAALLKVWQRILLRQIKLYSERRLRLPSDFLLTTEMLDGFRIYSQSNLSPSSVGEK